MEAALTKGIGNTPLLRLDRISRDLPQQVQLLAKAEWMNPGGSVKDRPAASMILDGEKRGALRPGLTILDATSGNTGVAYTMIGASRGYRVKLCAPANTEKEILATLRAYGAELILTDPAQAMDGASREVARIMAASPESYFFPDQMNNDANWKAHYEGTAAEIWEQTRGQEPRLQPRWRLPVRDPGADAPARRGNLPPRVLRLHAGKREGRNTADREIRSQANERTESRENRFLITPDQFKAAESAARTAGLQLVGIYHSHPDSPARPSEYDRDHAWPWFSYIIVSVKGGKADEAHAWQLKEDRSGFEAMKLEKGD